jgi:hypothetical protein
MLRLHFSRNNPQQSRRLRKQAPKPNPVTQRSSVLPLSAQLLDFIPPTAHLFFPGIKTGLDSQWGWSEKRRAGVIKMGRLRLVQA